MTSRAGMFVSVQRVSGLTPGAHLRRTRVHIRSERGTAEKRSVALRAVEARSLPR